MLEAGGNAIDAGVSGSLALTAVQQWTGTSEFDESEEDVVAPCLLLALQLVRACVFCVHRSNTLTLELSLIPALPFVIPLPKKKNSS